MPSWVEMQFWFIDQNNAVLHVECEHGEKKVNDLSLPGTELVGGEPRTVWGSPQRERVRKNIRICQEVPVIAEFPHVVT